jgi:exodeoxyribonuclease III
MKLSRKFRRNIKIMDLPLKRDKSAKLIKVISWNVCGLRSLLKKNSLLPIITKEDPDILCLNETKLQESQIDSIKPFLPKDYFSYFSCSSSKKGYSGVAILSKIEPISIQAQGKKHDQEGRTMIAEFEDFFVICTYVPCAGVKLKRLDYRVNDWDSDIRQTIIELNTTKNVIWCGDLNVVNEEIDIYSLKGKEKSGCCTPEERKSFKKTLEECQLVDSLRVVHPELKVFSYYPRRNVKAKEKDQGWRLDYINFSKNLQEFIREASVGNEYEGSDHYPVIAIFESDSYEG